MTIKEIRALTSLSQAKFCEKYHIPLNTFARWEQGKREPPDYLVELLEFKVRKDMEESKMKFTDEDLMNLIALCEQEEDTRPFKRLKDRCEKALVYDDVVYRPTEHDIKILRPLYDPDMDESAKETLEKILK